MARHARTAPTGRHRAGRPGRVPVGWYTGAQMSTAHRILHHWLARPAARHSFRSLARPRPVLAIIASL